MLLCAFIAAGLPHRDYDYGGRYWGKTFLLDERDQLSEWTGDLDMEPVNQRVVTAPRI